MGDLNNYPDAFFVSQKRCTDAYPDALIIKSVRGVMTPRTDALFVLSRLPLKFPTNKIQIPPHKPLSQISHKNQT